MSKKRSPGYISENAPAEIVMSFSAIDSVPSETRLNTMFRHFGRLKESETEVDYKASRARVVFKKCCDAEVAFDSAVKLKVFGSMAASFQLNYVVSRSFKVAPTLFEKTRVLEPKLEIRKLKSQITILKTELEEKSEALKSSESLNNTLILKELISRQELQEARSESITSLKEILGNRATLVFKRLGEMDHKAFQEACLRKFPNDNWGEKSAKLCSLWEEYLTDAKWQPFKKVDINGKTVEIVDEDDVKLKKLRDEYGEAVYSTVANALMDLNEHNPSGRYLVHEIWNPKEERIATVKEIIQHLVKQVKSLKTLKRKRCSV